jgi:hypothetical protein
MANGPLKIARAQAVEKNMHLAKIIDRSKPLPNWQKRRLGKQSGPFQA